MEKLLPATKDERGPFMWQIDQLDQVHSRSVVVGQGSQIRVFWLSGHELCTRIIQEDIMHQARPPRNCAVRASETPIAD